MGGRVASMVADELHAAGRVAGLLCLGYPFHPPGRPEQLRTAHLARLATPALICQGTRDPFGTREEVAGYALSDRDRDPLARGRRPRPEAAQARLRLHAPPDHLRRSPRRSPPGRADRRLSRVKIATFNVNNVNKRLANLLAWLAAAEPDVVCLQELKAADAPVPARRARGGGLRRGLARPADLERRRHPRPRRRAGADPRPSCRATPRTPRAATSRRRSRAS